MSCEHGGRGWSDASPVVELESYMGKAGSRRDRESLIGVEQFRFTMIRDKVKQLITLTTEQRKK